MTVVYTKDDKCCYILTTNDEFMPTFSILGIKIDALMRYNYQDIMRFVFHGAHVLLY